MTLFKTKWNSLLNRAEDPAETLDYSYEKQLELLQNVKRGVADVVTAKKRLELQAGKLETSVPKLESQAREALGANREDLARMALERKTAAQAQLQDLDRQVAELNQQQQKLEANEKTLSAKIESFRSQKEVMKAQYSAAEASVRIGEASTGIGDQMADTGAAIQRAQDKTEEMQARASAMDELIASGTLEDYTAGGDTQLDRELAQLTSKSKVDDELAKMKAELGTGEETEGDLAVTTRARLALGRGRAAPVREGRDGGELAAARRRGRLHRDRSQPRPDRPGTAVDPSPLARRLGGDRVRARRLRASPGRTSRSTSCGPGTASSISRITRSTRCAAVPTGSRC